jgi:hypothetical protein
VNEEVNADAARKIVFRGVEGELDGLGERLHVAGEAERIDRSGRQNRGG